MYERTHCVCCHPAHFCHSSPGGAVPTVVPPLLFDIHSDKVTGAIGASGHARRAAAVGYSGATRCSAPCKLGLSGGGIARRWQMRGVCMRVAAVERYKVRRAVVWWRASDINGGLKGTHDGVLAVD